MHLAFSSHAIAQNIMQRGMSQAFHVHDVSPFLLLSTRWL